MSEIKRLAEQVEIAEGTARCEHEKRLVVEQQRDELLAVLKMALKHLNPKSLDKERWKAGKKPYYINSIVSDAIAKIEGGQ